MIADPGQATNLASAEPDLERAFSATVAAWRNNTLPKTKDDRPFPVGYHQFPRTPLPARDGIPHGAIKRSAGAPNSSYFVNWTNQNDRVTWDIEVNATGLYDVEILYTCPESDAGSEIELRFNGSNLLGRVAPAWDPPLYTNQDTIPRPAAESKMKEFRELKLGSIHLEKGRGLLTLQAVKMPGRSVMDLRQINLTLQK